MRTQTIQITDYFTRLSGETAKSPAPTGSNKLLPLLKAVRRRDDLPTKLIASELAAAYRLGILHEVDTQKGVGWAVSARRLHDAAGDALLQAAEQLSAILALCAELLSVPSYEIQLDNDDKLNTPIEVFSTMYNAKLAQLLGATTDGGDQKMQQTSRDTDAFITTAMRKTESMLRQHGLRRSFMVVNSIDHKEKPMKKQAIIATANATASLQESWRTSGDGHGYHLEWTVDLIGGKPMRIICALERGGEAQRAAIETFVIFANKMLTDDGPTELVRVCGAVRGSFFGDDEPFVAFVREFAERFLSDAQRRELQLAAIETEQTDLLRAAEAVACERCGSSVEQFGDYAICLQCGDAQFVS